MPNFRAIESSSEAFDAWRDIPALERSETVLRWAALTSEAKDDLSRIITLENGLFALCRLREADVVVHCAMLTLASLFLLL